MFRGLLIAGVRSIGPAIRHQKVPCRLPSPIRRYTNKPDDGKSPISNPWLQDLLGEDSDSGARKPPSEGSETAEGKTPLNNEEFDKILDSLSFHFEQQKPTDKPEKKAPEFDLSIFEGLVKNVTENSSQEAKFVEEDEEEDLFKVEEDEDIINEEKNLFGKVFQNYLVDETNSNEEKKRWQLYDSVKNSKRKIDNLINLSAELKNASFASVSSHFKQQFFDRTKVAITPTLDYIDNELQSVEAKLEFLNTIIQEFQTKTKTPQGHDEVFLNKLLRKNAKKFTAKHEALVDSMYQNSIKNAAHPTINVFTIPLVFNKVLHSLSFHNYQGTLALSLFNLLKKDLNLYTVFVNQQTFNEILRIHWIYQGKSSLYGIEMIFLEMVNNGFPGDVMTYKTIKQLLLDYRRLRVGNYNTGRDTPIWTEEDNKRFGKLLGRTHQLSQELRYDL